MWNTADGIRTLAGAEAILVRSTIHELVDEICTSRLYDHGAVVVVVVLTAVFFLAIVSHLSRKQPVLKITEIH